MKFSRRQDPAPAPVEATKPTGPPKGAPVAAYAGILNGDSLTLAIEERPGTLALRAASGDVIGLGGRPSDEQSGYVGSVLDLAELTGSDATTWDLVLLPRGSGAPQPIWSPPLGVQPGGEFALRRSDAGTLQLTRTPQLPTPQLSGITAYATSVELEIAGGSGPITLVDDAGVVVATFAATTIDAGPLPAQGTGDLLQVLIGGQPIRRRWTDVPRPGFSVPLPEVYDDEGRARLKFRWSPDATLLARLVQEGDA